MAGERLSPPEHLSQKIYERNHRLILKVQITRYEFLLIGNMDNKASDWTKPAHRVISNG